MGAFKKLLKYFLITTLLFVVYSIFVYNTLDVGEDPIKSDVIISLEGGNRERSEKSVSLLREGYSQSGKIIVSPRIKFESGFDIIDWYTDAGASEDEIISEYESTSTWSNARNTIDLMKKHNWRTAIVVTSDYHSKRTKLVFDRLNKDKKYKFTFVSALMKEKGRFVSYKEYTANSIIAINEVIKYIGYKIYLYKLLDL